MKKLLLVSLCFLVLFMTQVYAQNRTVTGTVLSKDDGLPMPGVTVKVKGTVIATQTGVSGKYSLPGVPPNATLVFTYTGYASFEKVVPAVGAVDAQLEINQKQLGEVVVTGAYGIKREEKEAGYAQSHLTSSEVNESAETNPLQGLAGKVAGLQVTTAGTGLNPTTSVQLRGSRSINGSNGALIVVDGVPLNSSVSNIDPNTIESYDILEGGSASVLYGSEASNGVIVITTKKGSSTNKPTITYSNSIQADMVAFYPTTQRQYGAYGGETIAAGGYNAFSGLVQVVPYENEMYGPAYDGHTYQLGAPAGSPTGPIYTATYSDYGDPVKEFFNTGITEQNILGVNSGNQDDYINISGQDMLRHGVTPFETRQLYNATLKGGKKYGIFKVDYSINYSNALQHSVGSTNDNQAVNNVVQQWATNIPVKDFQDPNSTFGNPSDFFDGYAGNPYWAVYNAGTNSTTNTLLGNIKLTVSPTKYMDISYNVTNNFSSAESKATRSQINYTAYEYNDPLGEGNIASGAKAANGLVQGTVSDSYTNSSRLQGDLLAIFHPTLFKDIKTQLILGNTFYSIHSKTMGTSSSNLLIAGLYNVGYISGTPSANESESTQNNKAFYGDLQLGYKGYVFLDATARNESDSRLVASKRSYWYPGVNASFVFTDAIPALKGNKVLSYGKLRAAYSVTAEISVGAYNIYNTFAVTGGGFPYGSIGGLTPSSTNHTTIVPEKTTEIEGGIELGFFDNLIHTSVSVYKQADRNQTLGLSVSPTTGYSTVLTNVGEMDSKGFDGSLSVSVLTKAKNKVGLDLGTTVTHNVSTVISILNNVPQFATGGNSFAVVGQSYPSILGSILNVDPQGRTIITPGTGYPVKSASSTNYLGSSAPQWIVGLTANVSYKFMSLSVVGDYRGGNVTDYTSIAGQAIFTGASTYTTQNGRQSFIWPNSSYLDASGNYQPNTQYATQSGNLKFWYNSPFRSTTGPFVTNGAYWKLREANLGFNLNQFVKNYKWIKGLKFAFNGRNLFYWVPKTNFWGDPEVSVNSGTVPSTRTLGGKLDVTF